MTVRRLSSEAFVALLDRIELGGAEPDLHAHAADDASHLAFAAGLFGLRARPSAPQSPPWLHALAGDLAIGTVTPLSRERDQAGVDRAEHGTPAGPRRSTRMRRHTVRQPNIDRPRTKRGLRADAVVLTAMLAAVVGWSWHAMGTVEPRRRMPGSPTPASQPAILPTSAINGGVDAPGDETAEAPVAPLPSTTTTPMLNDAAYPPPAAPSTAAGTSTTTASAAPDDDRPRRERTGVPPPSGATDPSPYPGPPVPTTVPMAAKTTTPEPRVTRIGPRPVPTTAPTALPTAVATPAPRPLPPTPTPTLLPSTPTRPGGPTAPPAPSPSPSTVIRRNP